MASTLLAVVFAILLAHARPEFARLRQFNWFALWLESNRKGLSHTGFWQHGAGLLLGLGLPLILLGFLQYQMHGLAFGLFGLLLGVAVLFLCWGPRDLDLDVQTIQSASDTASRFHAVQDLAPEPRQPPIPLEAGALIDATFRAGLTRWFGVLFWFLLAGPIGALLYRLVQLQSEVSEFRNALSDAQQALVKRLLNGLDWVPAQLMTLSLALAADFDAVASAWRDFHETRGRYFSSDLGFLNAAARASVRIEENEDEVELGNTALPTLSRELGFAMALIWRILIVWLLVFAILVLAGWMT